MFSLPNKNRFYVELLGDHPYESGGNHISEKTGLETYVTSSISKMSTFSSVLHFPQIRYGESSFDSILALLKHLPHLINLSIAV